VGAARAAISRAIEIRDNDVAPASRAANPSHAALLTLRGRLRGSRREIRGER
jgi:hypothetical protein